MGELTPDTLDASGDIRTLAQDAGALDEGGTRRELLRHAGVGGGALVASGLLGAALSPLDAFAAAASTTGAYSTTTRSAANDVKIGNYALALEYLEAAFYTQAIDNGALTDPDILEYATVLATHEKDHVAKLAETLGSKAIKAPKVNFGTTVSDQRQFLNTAVKLEPVGTAAYAGAGPHIRSQVILKLALSIHSVEANHAAYALTLQLLKGVNANARPAPHAFNPSFTFNQTVAAVKKTKFLRGPLQP